MNQMRVFFVLRTNRDVFFVVFLFWIFCFVFLFYFFFLSFAFFEVASKPTVRTCSNSHVHGGGTRTHIIPVITSPATTAAAAAAAAEAAAAAAASSSSKPSGNFYFGV